MLLRNSSWFRLFALACAVLLLAGTLATAPAAAAGKGDHASSKAGKKPARHKASHRGSWRSRGQKGIDQARAREIQQALIRQGYLSGEANGQWDARSKEAMARYQADQGWQTKVVPDSRALIKLGLGPSNANLINPGTAATATPAGSDKPLSPGARQQ